jgi:hypothetical protein
MIRFIDHNKVSAEPFFLARQGLAPFSFSLSFESELETDLLYDWRFIATHFVSATSPLRLMAQ